MATRTEPAETTLELEPESTQTLPGSPARPPGDEPRLDVQPPVPVLRLAFAVGCSTVAAAVMVGGVFRGTSPRIWAGVAGVLGIVAAAQIRRIRNPALMNAAIIVAVIAVGYVLTFPAGALNDVLNLGPFVRDAVVSGDVQRPPVAFTLGWRAILGWLMGGLGFASAWLAVEFRRPALGMMLPLPMVMVAAISVADDARIASGIGTLVLFAVGLGLLSGVDLEEGGEQRSLAFELRRAARGLPLIAAVTVGLIFLSQANFLFPQPLYDPTQSAQKPKTVPLSEVPDRVLFTVESSVTGPWRMGSLDVYDGRDWRLPPFAENRIREVPRDGIVDSELTPGVRAKFEVQGLTGAVLPGLPNLVGLVAEGPKLAFDGRSGVIRLSEGTIEEGLEYTVVAGRIPSVQDLQAVDRPLPDKIEGIETERLLEIPPPPPAVGDLLRRAPTTSTWDRLDFLRNQLLDTVVANGAGTPVSVPPEKVADMLTGSREGTPFEIVAGLAMLARWAEVPARIGYGFDGGEDVEGILEVRPKHGASFLEVYFPGYKWLPIIGTPRQAEASFSNDPQQFDQSVAATDRFGASLYVPIRTETSGYLFTQVRRVLAVVLPIIAGLLLIWVVYPGVVKAAVRWRRRSLAQDQGPWARLALAYAELRDLATDFGYLHGDDTPLMFLDRVVPDEEHRQLAWLVTRALWGDLRTEVSDEEAAAADELSRSLRRRLGQAHPWTLRAVAAVSRLSLRHPYAPQLDQLLRRDHRDEPRAAAPAPAAV